MIEFNESRTITVDDVTVLPVHQSRRDWSYLPAPVGLARRVSDGRAEFTMIKVRNAEAGDGADGAGFLMFETNLQLEPATRERILAELRPMSDGEPQLHPVQFDSGTVKCVALDLEGGGGTNAPAEELPTGAFRATEKILGAQIPSLGGTEEAAFSLKLTQEGVIILEQAFEQGTTPIGVVYTLTYTGLRPALSVKITADLDRVYNHFSAGIEGKYFWLKGGIELALDFLRQQGAITIDVIDFTGEADKAQKEQWALDFFTKNLLKEWFEPTFAPVEAVKVGSGSPLSEVTKAVDKVADAIKNKPADTKPEGTPDKPKGDEQSKDEPKKEEPKKEDSGTSGAASPPSHLPAKLTITSRQPDPSPEGTGLTHNPADKGTVETVKVAGAPAKVLLDGKEMPLLDGAFTVDTAAGATHEVVVEYPAIPAEPKTFALLFDFDRPNKAGFTVAPPSRELRSYLDNKPVPADAPFSASTAPSGGVARGAEALRAWIRDRVADPKEVTIHATASFEGRDGAADHNQELSERRLHVARQIIGSLAVVSTDSRATGQTEAVGTEPISDPDDRAARVTAKAMKEQGRPAARVTATLSRPATPKKDEDKKDEDKKDDKKDDKKEAGGDPVGLTFKLKFVHQNERKHVEIDYRRTEAVQRIYAPQGFFGLLLDDLADKSTHFVEVDLDDPFFRQFEVRVSAPLDFARIGLTSAQVAIDYGDEADAENHHHEDFVFDVSDQTDKSARWFLNDRHETTYRAGVQFHFDPASGWRGRTDTLVRPPVVTEDRTLVLNPGELAGFLDVDVFPNRIDEELVLATDVELTHRFADGFEIRDVLRVEPGGPHQRWQVRTGDPNDRQYTVVLTHHLKDGTSRVAGPFTSSAAALPVDDPFLQPLEISVQPAFVNGSVRLAIVDVEYEDPANAYSRSERVTINGAQQDAVAVNISLVDPNQREFSFRLTVIGTDGSVRQDPPVRTADTLIVVQ